MSTLFRSSAKRWLAPLLSLAALAASPAMAYVVEGSANPNLAGRASGYSCCSGDSATGQSPTEVTGLTFSAGDALEFTVTGIVSYTPTVGSGSNPDGNESGSLTNYGDGISAPTGIRYNALVGVFLGDGDPTGSTTPAALAFASILDFETLAPGLGQIFFIGDGLTSDSNAGSSSGTRQQFIAPTGATRLFLGTSDGYGWFNNSGSFTVDVKVAGSTTPVSEPPLWALVMVAGLAAAGTRSRRSAR